jgi:ribosomal protein S18 acetylase RimI-like enzyme
MTFASSLMRPSIRLATKADLEVLTRLNAQVQAIHLAARPDYFREPKDRDVSQWLGGMLDDPTIVVWLAHVSGEPVGYVLVMIKERPANPFCNLRVTCEIDQIAVDANMRGTGVGRALIEEAFAYAEARGISHIELNVWAFNETARHAFEAMGFQPRVLTLERIQDR